MRNFRSFDIWQRAIQFTKAVYIITEVFPEKEKYGLTSQIRRASISIGSNIAEGSSRRTDKDFARFLEISIGTCFEVETQLVIAKEIEYLNEQQYDSLIKELEIIQKQLNQFISKLRKSN